MGAKKFTATLRQGAAVFFINASLVLLCVFLAARVLTPKYERKENVSLNKLGIMHTQLAAERLDAKILNLREELRENGLRLVNPERGPSTLDPAKWLWLRIQDRDWRAPNFLEALPLPKNAVDTWDLSSGKNMLVLSERVPIFKDGVQDFVLVEGGLQPQVLQDLQSDKNIGLWVFDMNAYKQGGLGVANLYERMSGVGSLTKDELRMLTSDFLGEIFGSQDVASLQGESPWSLFYQKLGTNSKLGILGYWVSEVPPSNLLPIWFSLALAMVFASFFASILLLRMSRSQAAVANETGEVPGTKIGLTTQVPPLSSGAVAVGPSSHEVVMAWVHKMAMRLQTPLKHVHDRVAGTLQLLQSDRSGALKRLEDNLIQAQTELVESEDFLQQVRSLSLIQAPQIASYDVESVFRDSIQKQAGAPQHHCYFDPKIWRVEADLQDLTLTLKCYLKFLSRFASPQHKVTVSARHVERDPDDMGMVEIAKSPNFKAPFLRLTFMLPTQSPLGKANLQQYFDSGLVGTQGPQEIELALSLKRLERLKARLKIKSSFEDGNVICLDLPAFEARKPADQVNAKEYAKLSAEVISVSVKPPPSNAPSALIKEVSVTTKPAEASHSTGTTGVAPTDASKPGPVLDSKVGTKQAGLAVSAVPVSIAPASPVPLSVSPAGVKNSPPPTEQAPSKPEKVPLGFSQPGEASHSEDEKTVAYSNPDAENTKERMGSAGGNVRVLRRAEIEKTSAFASELDEISRIRTRFKIRKPGEK